jgi:hypothetical protein
VCGNGGPRDRSADLLSTKRTEVMGLANASD